MAVTRIKLSPPLVFDQRTIAVIELKAATAADMFAAARNLGEGGEAELKNRLAALASGLPHAALRAVPLAVQRAIETWGDRQWREPPADLPEPAREPRAGDWIDAFALSGAKASRSEVEARIYAACAGVTLDAIARAPLSSLITIRSWYDAKIGQAVEVETADETGEEAGGTPAADPSPEG
ncbi:hypothetical protein [Phreatobacter stygius]|uniref:Uncharacterized protein n=1 Tax=Phreatobacter stygius TaxID=1940610 RepID=A0A4D7AUX6_9HYPH|nr:hypothetical protein [Phreatobacter stygius]QCI65524.1 hypothetical protein E8M01_15710 [Phreatobacter stygius]